MSARRTDPELLILISLAGGAKHGHAMLVDIEAFAGRRLGPGTLYGAIGRLDEQALIEVAGDDARRRPYRLTEIGRRHLAERLGGLRVAVEAGMARIGER
jgi:DNA-binding PadR family transcriptional regulator